MIALRTEPKSKLDLLKMGDGYMLRSWKKGIGPFGQVLDIQIHKHEMIDLVTEVLEDLGIRGTLAKLEIP